MNRLILRASVLGAVMAAVVWMVAYSPSRVSAAPVIPTGNVMVSVEANGLVDEFTPAGTLVQTLNTTKGAGTLTAGSAFDSTGNFYVTDFNANDVSEFDPTGTTLLGSFGSGYNADDESILFDAAGNAYVGQADGTHHLLKFSSTGALLATFAPAIEDRGTDWDDLAADQCTMLYTSEGVHVKSFDVCTNSQNADFAGPLPGSNAYALRILPKAVGSLPAGSVLVADTSEVTVLDNTGAQVRHDLTGVGASVLFALNLDPDGTSYWTGDTITGNVYRVDIATGTVLTTWSAGAEVGGITVKGEITAATAIPVCSGASASAPTLWPPNHKFVNETITGVTDVACGGVTTITIASIFQDEPTLGGGSGDTCPDGTGVGTSTAQVRSEREGTSDGRVYHIGFKATDCNGNSCTGTVAVCVPHDQGKGSACVDEGPLFDSTKCP
ncbi:MAG TPA: hypothetical protein VJY33_16850 [Isosphaeraceae bacterium]|nr:hypothetical protein [Isosphaeraceae bacterium]